VNDDAAVALLTDMVATPSVSGEEAAIAQLLVERMSAAGFDAHVDEAGNAVGSVGSGPKRLVMLGHMDTVPGDVPNERQGDLLYGRGSVDAKGPLATFVVAAARAAAELSNEWTVTVVGAVEEEAPTSKGARAVAPRWKPDACVIGEPSSSAAVTLGYKGRLLLDVVHRQGTGHSAGPEVSAPVVGVAIWNALAAEAERLNEGKTRVFDQITPDLLDVRTASDGLEATCRLTISWRTPLWFDADAWKAKARELADAAAAEVTGPAPELTWYGGEPAYKGDKSNPLVRAFLGAVRDEGEKPRFKVKTGTSDMNVVGPVWRCPILAYGPGDSKLDHTPNEHISITEYLQACRILTGVVGRLTAG
jgi:LysW-gamma-L-lysine carboxypeptidase